MKATQKLEENKRQAWLAGVGIFDLGREKAANTFDQIFVNSSAFFNELLEKGEVVESQLQAKLEAKNMLQDTLSALRAKLGIGNANRDQQLEVLSQRVDNLVEVVAKLAQQKAAEKKAAEKKATTAKEAPAKSAPAKTPAKSVTSRTAAAKTTETNPSTVKKTTSNTAATKAPAKPRTRKPAATKSTAATPAKKDNT